MTNTPIATTEPVANYLLQAMGFEILTPFSLRKGDHGRHRPVAAGRDHSE